MRKLVIAGNFKMFKTPAEAGKHADDLRRAVEEIRHVEIIIAPAYPALAAAASALGGSNVGLAAQNAYWEKEGAYTGEVSAGMLADVGCSHVIVGHSERRQFFGETDETVNRRAKACLEAGLTPIICVGETLEERQGEKTFEVLERQIGAGLAGINPGDPLRLQIAYEPVWAIGTGLTATPQQAQEAHVFIREKLSGALGEETAGALRILYGGSVKPENAEEILKMPDVDGALIGGASLKVDSFVKIIQAAEGIQSAG